jgi:ERO1-like protein alpha
LSYSVINFNIMLCLQGEHAHRIWSAIYNQSCFSDGVSCSEERVFYRLISGMHASISCHLAADYLLDEQQGLWGPNLSEFKERLGTPDKLWVQGGCLGAGG